MSMYSVFVFAIHKSLFSIHTRSKKSDFICPHKFTKCHPSGFRALLGSPWLAPGSYFGKMTPRGPRTFLNRSRTSKIEFLILKLGSAAWAKPLNKNTPHSDEHVLCNLGLGAQKRWFQGCGRWHFLKISIISPMSLRDKLFRGFAHAADPNFNIKN